MGTGSVYLGLAVSLALVRTTQSGGDLLVITALTAVPACTLLLGGYLLPRAGVGAEFYDLIAGWCALGIVVAAGLVALVEFTIGVTSFLTTATVLSAIAGVAGFWIGLYDAQSRARAAEAERQSRELQRQNAQLESVARMLAHELRNPLAIAQIYFAESKPRNEAAAAEVGRAHDRLEEMIDIMLVTVRSSKAIIDGETVSLREQAESAWNECPTQAASARLVVDTERTIQGTSLHVHRLLSNLFENSLEHGNGDTVVRVGEFADGFFVEDNGPGIPEANRKKATEAGFTTKPDGTGLGLTYVTHLAEMCGWEVTLTEGEHGGARFEFTGVNSDTDVEAPDSPIL